MTVETTVPPSAGADAALACHQDACCSAAPAVSAIGLARADLVRRAFRVEYATVAWMVIEAAAAISSAVRANSVSLLTFGIDSVIELASAGVVIWRLTVEFRRGEAFAEEIEHRASRIAGGLLFALAAYVVTAAAWKLGTRTGEEFSWPGLVITVLAIPICMFALPRRKIAIAEAMGSRAMRADAIESATCGWLSVAVVIGLVTEALTGAWWVDAATSLVIVPLLVKEGRAAWRGEGCGCC